MTLELEVPIRRIPKRKEKDDLIQSIQADLKSSGLESEFKDSRYNEKLGAGLDQVIKFAFEVGGSTISLAKALSEIFKKQKAQKTRIKIGENSVTIENKDVKVEDILKMIEGLKKPDDEES